MIKLLDSGFTRLKKSKIFWLLSMFSIGLALFIIFGQYNQMIKYDFKVEIDQIILDYAPIIGIVIAIFISLFFGVEYSDGGIRNKISIGHKRTNIYLSNVIISIITSIFSYLLFIAVVTIIGIPLFGGLTMELSKLLMLLGCVMVTVLAYCSIFALLAMLISNKTINAVVSIMLAFGLIMAALTCLNILSSPPTIQQATMVGGETIIDEVPNPKYPSEQKKKIIQTLLDINPAGEMFQIAGRTAPNLSVLPIYSLGIIIVTTGVGLVLFRRKELK